MTAAMQATQMQGQEREQEDRISELPDHILMNILDRFEEEPRNAVRTCVLSKRWRHIPGLLSIIVLDVAYYEANSDYTDDEVAQANVSLVEATKSILAHKSQHTINYLSIKFYLRDESIDIIRSVDNAMANREVIKADFTIIPEEPETSCISGRRFMTFLDGYTRAFGGLTGLCLCCLRFSKFDMPNVLCACKKLEHLILNRCDAGIGSVLQIEHPQLSHLSIIYCACDRIELNQLPRLTHLTCQSWRPSHDTYPLTFGYVPKLSVLILSSMSSVYHRNIRLSEFLRNVTIVNLDLNFQSRKIWIQPEATRPLAPLLRNLQMLRLRFIHEKCDLSWTMFILEAAPLLKEINIQVWDHVCNANEEDMSREELQMQQEFFKIESDHLSWEAHDFKHYNLSKLTIEGFQVEEKLKSYIRQVLKTAVNLELVALRKSRLCGKCRIRPSSMAYPQNEEQKDLIWTQISDQISSNARIRFFP